MGHILPVYILPSSYSFSKSELISRKMLVYKDVISGDELFSDSYPIELVDDLYYKVEGKQMKESNDIDERLIGGNAAVEEQDEDTSVDSSVSQGINIVLTHKLIETGFSKETFKDWLKTYMKALKARVEAKDPSRVPAFQTGMQTWARNILKTFDDWNFYLGGNMDPEGMVILCGYKEDQITPFFIFFKDGLEEEKF